MNKDRTITLAVKQLNGYVRIYFSAEVDVYGVPVKIPCFFDITNFPYSLRRLRGLVGTKFQVSGGELRIAGKVWAERRGVDQIALIKPLTQGNP